MRDDILKTDGSCPFCGSECRLEIYNYTDNDGNPGTENPMWEPIVFCMGTHSECPSFSFGVFGSGIPLDRIEYRVNRTFNKRVKN